MDCTQKKTSFKTNGLGKYPLYFEICLTYTLLSDLVNIYFRFGKIFISQGVVFIYTLASNLVDIHFINSGTWKHTLYLGIQLTDTYTFYFGMSVNITGTLYLLKLTININFIMGLDKHTP